MSRQQFFSQTCAQEVQKRQRDFPSTEAQGDLLRRTDEPKRDVQSETILQPKIVRTLPTVEPPSCKEEVLSTKFHGRAAEEQDFGIAVRKIPYAVDIPVFGKRASRQMCVLVPITHRKQCVGEKMSCRTERRGVRFTTLHCPGGREGVAMRANV